MKIIRFLICAFAAAVIICVLPAGASAEDYYDEQLAASGAGELKKELSEDTNEYLERLGYDNIDFESIFSSEPGKLINLLLEIACGKIGAPLKTAVKLAAIIMLVTVAQSFCPDDDKSKTIFDFISCGALLVAVFSPAYSAISAGFSAVGVCAGFEKALIPVLAAVLTACGNPAAALSYRGFTFAAAQGITVIMNRFALPLTGMAGALAVSGALSPNLKISAVSELLNKAVVTVLTVAAGLFSAVLAIKNTLAASADTLAAKGIKLVANTFVPVLGGALGEAYGSISGSLVLVKNSVGAFAIAAVFLTVVPVIFELVIWIFSIKVAEICAQLMGSDACAEMLKAVNTMFVMAAVLTAYCTAVFIVSSGTVLSLRSA